MPRIAWFSPLDPGKSLKSSSFSRAVLARAPEDWDIELFTDEECLRSLGRVQAPKFLDYPIYVHHQAFLRDSSKPFDAFVFQLENHSRCGFVRRAMQLWPGLIVCHDAGFSELELSAFGHSTTGAALNDRLLELYGDEAPALGDWQARGWSIESMSSKYLNTADLRGASLLLATTERAKQELGANNPDIPVSITAFPVKAVRKEAASANRSALRQKLGLAQGSPILTTCADVFVEDRMALILEAFSNLHAELLQTKATPSEELVHLVWILESPADTQRVKSIVDRYAKDLPQRVIHFVNAESEESRLSWIDIGDIFLAPRFSNVRGISLEVLGALARGIPSIVPRFGAEQDIPKSAALHVSVGAGECAEITDALRELLSNRQLYQAVSDNARSFVEVVCDPGAVVEDMNVLLFERGRKLARDLEARRGEYGQSRRAFSAELMDSLSEQGLAERAVRDFSWQHFGRQ